MLTSSFRAFFRQNRPALYCFLLSAFLFFLASLDLQGKDTPRLYTISPLIGPEIDLNEFFYYRFNEIEQVHKKDFLSAQVFLLTETTFQLQIELQGGKKRIKNFDKNFLSRFQINIQRFGKKLLRSLDRLESEIGTGQNPFIQVELTNDIIMRGEVLELNPNGFGIRSEIGEFNFMLETVKAITFLDDKMTAKERLAYAR